MEKLFLMLALVIIVYSWFVSKVVINTNKTQESTLSHTKAPLDGVEDVKVRLENEDCLVKIILDIKFVYNVVEHKYEISDDNDNILEQRAQAVGIVNNISIASVNYYDIIRLIYEKNSCYSRSIISC